MLDTTTRALRAGVRSYLLKGITSDELVAAIRMVNEGRSYVTQEIFEKLTRRLEAEDLTPREIEVLEHIVQGRSNKQISSLFEISGATVKAHINNLLNKLGVSDHTQAVTAAINRGVVTLDVSRRRTPDTDPTRIR